MYIRLKDIILKYNIEGRIVLRFNSELIDIEDNNGDINYLFSLLNGKYTENDIISLYFQKYNTYDVTQYLDDLKSLQVIEYVYNDPFDKYFSVRWSRNLGFFDSLSTFGSNKFLYQEKLFKSKICILGCGGLGSHILYELSAVGFLNITIVDFDKIELSNLNRQILYKESDIGYPKVVTAKKNILEFNSKMNIITVEKNY